MTKKERLEAMIAHYCSGKPSVFARKLGVAPSTISSWLSRDTFDSELIFSKCENINPNWLISGVGDMLKDSDESQNANFFNKKNQISATSSSNNTRERKLIPFYDDVASVGGFNNQVANVEQSLHPVAEWIDAGDWFQEATAAIRHYGDSMIEYPSGSILALKQVNDIRLIIPGRNYVVETSEFRVTKQLQPHKEDNTIIAYSTNRETYPDGSLVNAPFPIPLETIRTIWQVLGCVIKEYSSGAVHIIK